MELQLTLNNVGVRGAKLQAVENPSITVDSLKIY